MKKIQIMAIVLGFMCLVVYISKTSVVDKRKYEPNIEEKRPKYDTVEQALAKISASSAQKTVEFLASDNLEGRMSGKKGNVIAAKYIKDKFSEMGYTTQYQKFNINRINPGPNNEIGDNFTQNICAWLDGKDPILKKDIVVIGAHMDHIGYGPNMSMTYGKPKIHPGADDNASGTAALLEIANGMSKLENKRTILLIAFSAEEMGLLGSRFYTENPILPVDDPSIKRHIFMLNMDMVGYLKKSSYGESFKNMESSVDITKYIGELSSKYSFAKSITTRSSGGSDHASFYNKKIPVAFLHTGGHNYYHTPQDTADKLNYEGIERVAKYALEITWRVCNETRTPVFNYSTFKSMPMDHDHGIKKFN